MPDGSPPSSVYLVAADALLILHVLFVGFVIFGLVLTLLGKFLDWSYLGKLLGVNIIRRSPDIWLAA